MANKNNKRKDIANIKLKNNYFKNVAKSVNYAAKDTAKELMPDVYERYKNVKDATKYVTENFKNINQAMKGIDNKVKTSQSYKDAQDGLKNLKSDFKSGNWYNKKRKDEVEGLIQDEALASDMAGLGDDDSDIFGGFSDDDSDLFSSESESDDSFFGDDDDLDLDGNPDPSKFDSANFIKPNKTKYVKQIDNRKAVQFKSYYTTKDTSSLDINLAEIGMQNDNRNTNIISNLFMKHTGETISALESINNNVTSLVTNTNDVINPFIEQSARFYEDNINSLKGINETLTQTFELIKAVNQPEEEDINDRYKSAFSRAFASDSSLDMDNYKKMVKANLDEAMASSIGIDTGTISEFYNMFKEMGGFKAAMANPLGSLMTMGMKRLITEGGKDKLGTINEYFANIPYFINERLLKMKKKGGFGGFLGSIFGMEHGSDVDYRLGKSTVDLKKARAFSVQDHEALTKVIPHYLEIIATNTGNIPKIKDNPYADGYTYNYKEGTFQTAKESRAKFEKELRSTMESSTYSSTSNFGRSIEELNKLKPEGQRLKDKDLEKEVESQQKAFQTFLNMMALKGIDLDYTSYKDLSKKSRKEFEDTLGKNNISNIWSYLESIKDTSPKEFNTLNREYNNLRDSMAQNVAEALKETSYTGLNFKNEKDFKEAVRKSSFVPTDKATTINANRDQFNVANIMKNTQKLAGWSINALSDEQDNYKRLQKKLLEAKNSNEKKEIKKQIKKSELRIKKLREGKIRESEWQEEFFDEVGNFFGRLITGSSVVDKTLSGNDLDIVNKATGKNGTEFDKYKANQTVISNIYGKDYREDYATLEAKEIAKKEEERAKTKAEEEYQKKLDKSIDDKYKANKDYWLQRVIDKRNSEKQAVELYNEGKKPKDRVKNFEELQRALEREEKENELKLEQERIKQENEERKQIEDKIRSEKKAIRKKYNSLDKQGKLDFLYNKIKKSGEKGKGIGKINLKYADKDELELYYKEFVEDADTRSSKKLKAFNDRLEAEAKVREKEKEAREKQKEKDKYNEIYGKGKHGFRKKAEYEKYINEALARAEEELGEEKLNATKKLTDKQKRYQKYLTGDKFIRENPYFNKQFVLANMSKGQRERYNALKGNKKDKFLFEAWDAMYKAATGEDYKGDYDKKRYFAGGIINLPRFAKGTKNAQADIVKKGQNIGLVGDGDGYLPNPDTTEIITNNGDGSVKVTKASQSKKATAKAITDTSKEFFGKIKEIIVDPLGNLLKGIGEKVKKWMEDFQDSEFFHKFIKNPFDKAKNWVKEKTGISGKKIGSEIISEGNKAINKIFNIQADAKEEKKGKLASLGNLIKEKFDIHIGSRMKNLGNKLFGEEKMSSAKQFTDKMFGELKGKGSTIVADASLGAIAGLFLPGGPILGGLVGTGVGFAAQSETFKNLIFGDNKSDDEKNGFQKVMTTVFKDKLPNYKFEIGAGLLGSLFLPGGPIIGAATGALGAHFWKSNKDHLKRLLFGDFKRGEGDKRSGRMGILTRIGMNLERTILLPFTKWSLKLGGKLVGLIDKKFLLPFQKGAFWAKGIFRYFSTSIKHKFKQSNVGKGLNFLFNAMSNGFKKAGSVISKTFNGLFNFFGGALKKLFFGEKQAEGGYAGGLLSPVANIGQTIKHKAQSKLIKTGAVNMREYQEMVNKANTGNGKLGELYNKAFGENSKIDGMLKDREKTLDVDYKYDQKSNIADFKTNRKYNKALKKLSARRDQVWNETLKRIESETDFSEIDKKYKNADGSFKGVLNKKLRNKNAYDREKDALMSDRIQEERKKFLAENDTIFEALKGKYGIINKDGTLRSADTEAEKKAVVKGGKVADKIIEKSLNESEKSNSLLSNILNKVNDGFKSIINKDKVEDKKEAIEDSKKATEKVKKKTYDGSKKKDRKGKRQARKKKATNKVIKDADGKAGNSYQDQLAEAKEEEALEVEKEENNILNKIAEGFSGKKEKKKGFSLFGLASMFSGVFKTVKTIGKTIKGFFGKFLGKGKIGKAIKKIATRFNRKLLYGSKYEQALRTAEKLADDQGLVGEEREIFITQRMSEVDLEKGGLSKIKRNIVNKVKDIGNNIKNGILSKLSGQEWENAYQAAKRQADEQGLTGDERTKFINEAMANVEIGGVRAKLSKGLGAIKNGISAGINKVKNLFGNSQYDKAYQAAKREAEEQGLTGDAKTQFIMNQMANYKPTTLKTKLGNAFGKVKDTIGAKISAIRLKSARKQASSEERNTHLLNLFKKKEEIKREAVKTAMNQSTEVKKSAIETGGATKRNVFKMAQEKIREAFKTVWEKFTTAGKAGIETIGSGVRAAATAAKAIPVGGLAVAAGIATAGVASVIALRKKLKKKADQAAKSNKAPSVEGDIKDAKNSVDKAKKKSEKKFSLKKGVKKLGKGIKNTAKKVKGAVGSVINKVKKSKLAKTALMLNPVTGGVMMGIKGVKLAKKAIKGAPKMFNKAKGAVGSVIGKIKKNRKGLTKAALMLNPATRTALLGGMVAKKLGNKLKQKIITIAKIGNSTISDTINGKNRYLTNSLSEDTKAIVATQTLTNQLLIKGLNLENTDGAGIDATEVNKDGTTTKKKGIWGGIKSFFGNVFGGKGGGSSSSWGKGKGQESDVPYYSQTDSRWGNKSYASNNMSTDGCAPTAMAMVASKLTGSNITPDVLANYATASNETSERGTSYDFIDTSAGSLGINASRSQNPSVSTLVNTLRNSKKPIILNGYNPTNGVGNPYTSEGHYVVATGVNPDGTINIQDPRGSSFNMPYNAKDLADSTSMAWKFDGSESDVSGDTSNQYGKAKKASMEDIQNSLVNKMKSVEKKLTYSQSGPRDPEKGSADCSSTVGWAYRKILGINPGSTTVSILNNNSAFDNVDVGTVNESGGNGYNSRPNESNLQKGDLLLFARPNSDFSRGRKYRVGHVEMYMGNGQMIGHGSTPGTKIKKLGNQFIVAKRYKKLMDGSAKALNLVGDTGSTSSGDSSSSSSSNNNSNGNSGNILTDVLGMFSKFATKLFTGKDEDKENGDNNNSSNNNNSSSNNGSVSKISATGKNNAEKVWNYFTGSGYSDAATAGILGNLNAESGINPTAIQKGSGHAAGIAQWESYKKRDGRWKNMSKYAASKGKPWTDLQSQLEYIDKELKGYDIYFKKDRTINDIDGKSYRVGSTTYNEWKKSTDVSEATKQFEKSFERAGKPRMANRLTTAKDFFNKFSGSGKGWGKGSGIATAQFNSDIADPIIVTKSDYFKDTADIIQNTINANEIYKKDNSSASYEEIIEILKTIAVNTSVTADSTKRLAEEGITTVLSLDKSEDNTSNNNTKSVRIEDNKTSNIFTGMNRENGRNSSADDLLKKISLIASGM